MKFLKKSSLPLLSLVLALMLSACGGQLEYTAIERNSEMTGGSLTFSYDRESHTAIFGGQGEFVQFYSKDITKGWEEDGCRVGIVLTAPSNIKDFESGSLTIDGKKFIAGEFYQTVNNQKVGRVELTPLVSQDKREIEIKISWSENSPAQVYKIKIKDGTEFMQRP